MKNLENQFDELLRILEDGNILPWVQVTELSRNPRINPTLYPDPPQPWWLNCFDWFVEVPLIPGGDYGPFYRVNEGSHFWPTIGNPAEMYSEKECFFGLKIAQTVSDFRALYNPIAVPRDPYLFKIRLDQVTGIDGRIFLGSVAGGTGFQMNPNGIAVNFIRSFLVSGDKACEGEKLNWTHAV